MVALMRVGGAVLVAVAMLAAGCGAAIRRFPLRDAMWRDTDLEPVEVACRPDPEEPAEQLCRPEEYVSSFAWDGADNLIFRPVANFFAVAPGGESVNVNAMDEVPDSAWFTNRIGMHPMTPEQVAAGYCAEEGGAVLDVDGPDGSWVIDMGKPNGANPGFRVIVNGMKFMLKADPPDQPERATGATSIVSRLYYAAGWWAPCDSVVYLRPSLLSLRPGLMVTDNSGNSRPFDRPALDALLHNASHRGELVRMVASRWLPGRAIGPFRYEGTRDDDPNDVVPHEDRRDLRGARVIAAWLNHFDSREQNTMDTWMAVDARHKDSSPGYVRHWYIDLGDCFGSEWAWEGMSKRLGYAYYLDFEYVAGDFASLGLVSRPWDHARRSPDGSIFGFYRANDFEPDSWVGGYPNPAFQRMTERDAAWATRVLARMTPEHIDAALSVGDYTAPEHRAFLRRVVLERHRRILRRYLSRLSPIADLRVDDGTELCGADLARQTGLFPEARFAYAASIYAGPDLAPRPPAHVGASPDGSVCVSLAHFAPDGGAEPGSVDRYAIVDITNGQAEGALRAHLYDLGPARGFRLVGIERPDDADPPRP